MKGVLWKVAKRLSYIQDARCLKVKEERIYYNILKICETEGSSLKYGYFYCDIITRAFGMNTKSMDTACRNM